MPVVQSIDGVFSLYRERRGARRGQSLARPKLSTPQEDRSPANPAYVLAQQAYEKGSGARARKPVVVARDIMSVPVTVLPAGAPVVQAWGIMRGRQFRHLPIVSDSGVLVGMITDQDLLHASHGTEGRVMPPFPLVREVMTRDVITATPETPIREIIEVMLDEQISAIPILNDRYHPVGILTTTDILRALLNRAPLELWT